MNLTIRQPLGAYGNFTLTTHTFCCSALDEAYVQEGSSTRRELISSDSWTWYVSPPTHGFFNIFDWNAIVVGTQSQQSISFLDKSTIVSS